jgi:oxepin-CoA hydrolase/3-oxo-5,6-dehydrosuberyl-CoA semialdehyde dehydrogenase
MLQSYAEGRWYAAADEGQPLLDASTGEEVARFSATGLDYAALASYARDVGGPALRALTFHERAGILKDLGKHLMANVAEFHELSLRTGATRGDGMGDIEGGIGTLFASGSVGTRQMPNDTVFLDDNVGAGGAGPIRIGREGTFVGQHIFTSRPGVMVQINAFNFPVWGMLEKFGPAFLAGMPSLVKPAAQTSYVTEAVVRCIADSGLLPEGSLQLLMGAPEGLLDVLGIQDHVAFTGSARTAGLLRRHAAVLDGGVTLGVEADSLNCSILGPDVGVDDPEFDLFVKGVATEITYKAGQKCTAIRRALVPTPMVGPVLEALTARLTRTTVGHPAADGVRMGALVSLAQRDAVRTAIAALGTSAEIVYGDPQHVDVVGADAERGAFLGPVLLRADASAAEPHAVEAFGPVSTVIGFDTVEQAVALAARGRGSLAGSVVTADPAVAREVTLGLAPWHGRVLVLDRHSAAESTGHGVPLPTLSHGGPGRAGGGQEMGGLRGVLHLMQRTAVQGSPDMLTAITGRWTTGSARIEDGTHPFRKSLADLRIGDTIASVPRQVTLADIDHFAEFTGDTFYAHTDPVAAAANPLFGGIVAHGYLVVSLAAGLFVDPDPGPVLANFGVDNLRFLTPVKADDTIAVTLTVKQITPRTTADYGEVRWDAVVVNAAGDPVATYDVLTLVAKTWPPQIGPE